MRIFSTVLLLCIPFTLHPSAPASPRASESPRIIVLGPNIAGTAQHVPRLNLDNLRDRNNISPALGAPRGTPPPLTFNTAHSPRSSTSEGETSHSSLLFSSDDETVSNAESPYTQRNTLIMALTLQADGNYGARLLPLNDAIQALLQVASHEAYTEISPESARGVVQPLIYDYQLPLARHIAEIHGKELATQLPDFIEKLQAAQKRTLRVEVDISGLRLAKATVAGLSAMACLFGAKSIYPKQSNGRFIPVLAAASSAGTMLKLTALASACGFGLWQVRKIFGFMHDLAARNAEQNEQNQALQTELMRSLIQEYDSRIDARLATVEHDVTLAHDNVTHLQQDLATMKETLETIGNTHATLTQAINTAVEKTDLLIDAIIEQAERHHRHKTRYQDAQEHPAQPVSADTNTGVNAHQPAAEATANAQPRRKKHRNTRTDEAAASAALRAALEADPAAAGAAAIERAQNTAAQARDLLDQAIARNHAAQAETTRVGTPRPEYGSGPSS